MNTGLFESGLEPARYASVLRNYRSFVRKHMPLASAKPEHIAALRKAAGSLPQPVRGLIMTEDWCGDSACNLPVLTSLFDGAGIELRVVRGSEHSQIKEYYENDGTDHIPVLSVWDGEWNEIVRWVEAPAAVTAEKDTWKMARPEFMELYRHKDDSKEAGKKFATLYAELLGDMITWYKTGMWDETTREIVERLP